MTYFHPAWLEHQRKRYLRADAYRFAAPGTPEAKMPGWLDPSATRVRWKEAQEAEARRQAQAARDEAERKLLELHCEIKTLQLEHELWLFEEKYGFNPDQPRDELGRWTSVGNAVPASSEDDSLATAGDAELQRTELAQADFGTLVTQFPVPGGRRCVYDFGAFRVVVPGPTNFLCSPVVHWSGVVHGRLLNDN